MNTTNKEIKEMEERLLSFRQEVEGLRDISDAEEYAKQLAHLFLGNGLSLQTILLMAIDFGQQHPNWISVEDELPKEKQKVLAYFSSNEECEHEYACMALYNYGFHHWEDAEDSGIILEGVTHWMPIVPPRKEDKK